MEDNLISITALQGHFLSVLLFVLNVVVTEGVEAGAVEESQEVGL